MQRLDISKLSDRAKAVCGAWFGIMHPGKGSVTFEMGNVRPSDDAQAGLDELVLEQAISVEPTNDGEGMVYRPIADCRDAFVWLGENRENPAAKFMMVTKLESRLEAKQHTAAALAVMPVVLS